MYSFLSDVKEKIVRCKQYVCHVLFVKDECKVQKQLHSKAASISILAKVTKIGT